DPDHSLRNGDRGADSDGAGRSPRSRSKGMTMTDQKKKTALLLVDVINSFFDPSQPNYYKGVEDVLEPMRQLRAAAKASGAVTVHAVERHRPGFDDFEWRKLPLHHIEDAFDA